MNWSEIPWATGLRIFVSGFGGVFIALAMLWAGLKVMGTGIRLIENNNKTKQSEETGS